MNNREIEKNEALARIKGLENELANGWQRDRIKALEERIKQLEAALRDIQHAVDKNTWDVIPMLTADIARAVLDQKATALRGSAPEGFALVPIEPTKEMIQASIWALDRWREKHGNVQAHVPPGEKHQIRWRAMLTAATP